MAALSPEAGEEYTAYAMELMDNKELYHAASEWGKKEHRPLYGRKADQKFGSAAMGAAGARGGRRDPKRGRSEITEKTADRKPMKKVQNESQCDRTGL